MKEASRSSGGVTPSADRVKGSMGLTCPTCRVDFPKHMLVEHPQMPGGFAIAEYGVDD